MRAHSPDRARPLRRGAGLSLIELTVVIAILGITALAVIPDLSSTDPLTLDLAANEVAAALRFARNEAIRTGYPQGVLVDQDDSEPTGGDVIVYQVDLTASPFGIHHILYHPLSKQPYDLRVRGDSRMPGVALTNTVDAFDIQGLGRKKHVHFTSRGRPVYYQDQLAHRLLSGQVRVGKGALERTITLDPVTGRVSVQ